LPRTEVSHRGWRQPRARKSRAYNLGLELAFALGALALLVAALLAVPARAARSPLREGLVVEEPTDTVKSRFRASCSALRSYDANWDDEDTLVLRRRQRPRPVVLEPAYGVLAHRAEVVRLRFEERNDHTHIRVRGPVSYEVVTCIDRAVAAAWPRTGK
jgi:hypothetical protein